MMIGILQPGYIPWLGFFEQMWKVEQFILHDDLQYTVGDWRNRNRIRTEKGWAWLSVPVKGGSEKLISDIEIDYSHRWQAKHVNLLRQCYSKAEHFERYFDDLRVLLMRKYDRLVDLDLELIRYISSELGITTPIVKSSELGITGKKTERLVNICKAVGGDRIYEGASGRSYMDERLLASHKIDIEYQDYMHPTYKQQYDPFIPYMSTLDILFCCGPDARKIVLLKH